MLVSNFSLAPLQSASLCICACILPSSICLFSFSPVCLFCSFALYVYLIVLPYLCLSVCQSRLNWCHCDELFSLRSLTIWWRALSPCWTSRQRPNVSWLSTIFGRKPIRFAKLNCHLPVIIDVYISNNLCFTFTLVYTFIGKLDII
jgi:hypothetical protein